MPLFTSPDEKKYWFWALAVFITIISTLFLGQPLIELFGDQNIRAVIFLMGMFLVGGSILVHMLKTKPSKIELTVIFGIAAVYVMFILRLGMPERSHLFEYSVLAIFIHKALIERVNHGKLIRMPALIALVISFLIGVLDECIQIFIPDRVFDPADIVFNGFVVLAAIGTRVVFIWVRKRINKIKRNIP